MKKNPLQSVTLWGLVIILVANLLKPFGMDLDVEVTSQLVEEVINFWPEILEAIGLVLAFIGRVRASKPITFTGK